MLCIWISSKGKWDLLLSEFLHKTLEAGDDCVSETYAGSNMLENLRNELANLAPPDADLWGSVADDADLRRSGYNFENDKIDSRESFIAKL